MSIVMALSGWDAAFLTGHVKTNIISNSFMEGVLNR